MRSVLKMKVTVYLNSDCFSSASSAIRTYKDDYVPERDRLECVGEIEAEDIDEAWALLQHIDSRDSAIPDRRSASVGDVFETPEGFFLVQGRGFKKLDWK